jgi:small-conductance mechanosensitive channel
MVQEKTVKTKLALVFLIFGVAMYLLDANNRDEMDRYINGYNEYKTKAEATTRFADSLQTQILIQENETRAAQARADMAAQRATQYKAQTVTLATAAAVIRETVTDTAELARTLIPLQDSIIEQQHLTIQEQNTQITELESALNSKDNSLTFALQRGDSLQTVINLLPPAPKNPNRMFGIKLPSRKVVLAVGVAIGIITKAVVLK